MASGHGELGWFELACLVPRPQPYVPHLVIFDPYANSHITPPSDDLLQHATRISAACGKSLRKLSVGVQDSNTGTVTDHSVCRPDQQEWLFFAVHLKGDHCSEQTVLVRTRMQDASENADSGFLHLFDNVHINLR